MKTGRYVIDCYHEMLRRQLSTFIGELRQRGLVSQLTSEDIKGPAYCGADPSAPSLHLGNLLPLMVLLHFNLRGQTVIPLVGGATGTVGDPSGRMSERKLMEHEQREKNVRNIQNQMRQFFQNGALLAKKYGYSNCGTVKLRNNVEWWKDITFLGFLGRYGRHIRVSAMLGRESVRQRLASGDGLGFGEFAYQVLQAYDFWKLYSTEECLVQIGGHDQWGNITAGIDLINRLKQANAPEPQGITVPLLTTPSGEKFGKSAGNAVFLDKTLTTPYHLYQYLLNVPDEVVLKYLKMFTLLPLQEIEGLKCHNPELRVPQRKLAREVCELVHGSSLAEDATTVSEVIFDHAEATPGQILGAFDSQGLVHELPVVSVPWKKLLAKITSRSGSECERLLKQRSVYVGTARRAVENRLITSDDLDDQLLLVRIGKTEYHAIKCK